ncbi:MAG: hypothetical protein KF760_33040 [Candidatus Eremiobacteraeota bacterium]|nr:hypothetical protein [Candidatus Eremiobacteraeota bacterium]MCW5871614.1 hypothetical protein [Candidatus Eremiobacteraeota bacterium]
MFGYVLTQLARRLTTQQTHPDPEVAERAERRAEQWRRLLDGVNSGELEVGSRTPVRSAPAWATLEVLTGGFASGAMLAAGPLQPHELALGLTQRSELNAHFLSAEGLAQLRQLLASGHYRLELPEEGAWLVLAWLEQHGHLDPAARLLETLLPYSGHLRFYPIPREQAPPSDLGVHVCTVAQVRESLNRKRPNERILAQKEAIEVWAPLYDQMLALFQETVRDGWPCRFFPEDWAQRAQQLARTCGQLRLTHQRCARPRRMKHSFAQLLAFLERDPSTLSGREVGRIRLILQRSEHKHGLPGSERRRHYRQLQRQAVEGPTHQVLAGLLGQRMASLPAHEGVEDLEPLRQPLEGGYPIPASLLAKVERCLHASLEELVERGRIPSGEVLADILPQLTSQLRAAEFDDPALGRLYASIYRAFRKRRSLLLLNLQSQVRLEELPWVAALEPFRRPGASAPSRLALESLSRAALCAFPQTLLPNKLIREMSALAAGAGLKLAFTEELAADIFTGRFASHYGQAARQAQEWLRASLYQVYYSIQPEAFDDLASVCQTRAGVTPGSPAQNGQILEQQQILTTHNLAALWFGLSLHLDTGKLALACFRWICHRLQLPPAHWRHQLLEIKNSAYAWRQMLFFLSVGEAAGVTAFLDQARPILQRQPPEFQRRFDPVWQGLLEATQGRAPARPLLGWSQGKHWLVRRISQAE